jgi:hypothetical protein
MLRYTVQTGKKSWESEIVQHGLQHALPRAGILHHRCPCVNQIFLKKDISEEF